MKNIFLLLAMSFTTVINAQTTYEVSPKPTQDFDIVTIPFGLDHSIKVGVLNQSGKAILNSTIDISDVSESVRTEYSEKLSEALGFTENMLPVISEKEDIEVNDPGPYMLFPKGDETASTPSGFLILLSDTALFQWVMNPDESTPVFGSTYDLIYVSEDFDYKGTSSEVFADDSDDTETIYHIDLHLKPGWNYIAYTIERIKPATGDIAAFPDKVSVTSLQSLPSDVKWVAYYY